MKVGLADQVHVPMTQCVVSVGVVEGDWEQISPRI